MSLGIARHLSWDLKINGHTTDQVKRLLLHEPDEPTLTEVRREEYFHAAVGMVQKLVHIRVVFFPVLLELLLERHALGGLKVRCFIIR